MKIVTKKQTLIFLTISTILIFNCVFFSLKGFAEESASNQTQTQSSVDYGEVKVEAKCTGGCTITGGASTVTRLTAGGKIAFGTYSCPAKGAANATLTISVNGTNVQPSTKTAQVCRYQRPVCGNDIVEPGEECDGREFCSDCKLSCAELNTHECKKDFCQSEKTIKSSDGKKSITCYGCGPPTNDPCESATDVEGSRATGEGDQACEGACTKKVSVSSASWICPPGTTRGPTTQSIYCCRWNELTTCTPQSCLSDGQGHDTGGTCENPDTSNCDAGTLGTFTDCDCNVSAQAGGCPNDLRT